MSSRRIVSDRSHSAIEDMIVIEGETAILVCPKCGASFGVSTGVRNFRKVLRTRFSDHGLNKCKGGNQS